MNQHEFDMQAFKRKPTESHVDDVMKITNIFEHNNEINATEEGEEESKLWIYVDRIKSIYGPMNYSSDWSG